MGNLIAIDVDNTIIDMNVLWSDWYKSKFEETLDLSEYISKDSEKCLFWRNSRLYDNLTPTRESIESINRLYSQGYHIVFVSDCFEEHRHSKYLFLNRHFNFHGFIDISDKFKINYDIIIDDNINNIIDRRGILFTGDWSIIMEEIDARYK